MDVISLIIVLIFFLVLSSFIFFKKKINYPIVKEKFLYRSKILDETNHEESNDKEKLNWLQIQKKYENAVVQIFSVSSMFNWIQPFKGPAQVTISGSGFFINDKGYLITNSHVVDQAKSVWIQVPALGRKNIDADIISVCPDRDLALLKIRNEGFNDIKLILKEIPFIQLGDSDKVHRTDKILTFGYPLGQHYLKTTTGIVSGREHIDQQLFIQIDAPINPGSSGGPVLNEKGEVIGISNVMVPAAQNVGYIIPINELKIIINDLYSAPFLRKQSLGLGFNNITYEQVRYLKNPEPGGLFVSKVYKNSIAEGAGIKVNDMIYEINGYKLDIYGDASASWGSDKISILDIISRFNVGQDVNMIIYRNGERIELNFKFENAPIYPIRLFFPEYEKIDFEILGGIVIMELTENHVHNLFPISPELARFERAENQIEPQLVISHVLPSSEVFRLNSLMPGNIIKEINEIKVNTLNDLRQALKKSLTTGFITIKTEYDVFLVLNLLHVLKDEFRLAKEYRYNLTPMVYYMISTLQTHFSEENKK